MKIKSTALLAFTAFLLMTFAQANSDICQNSADTDEVSLDDINAQLPIESVEALHYSAPVCAMGVPGPTCSDTDGGIVPEVKGTVSGTLPFIGGYSFTDFCMPCHPNKLIEFYCKDGHCGGSVPAFDVITCENGCENGACKEPEIPEFTLIAGGIALAGAIAGFVLLRRK